MAAANATRADIGNNMLMFARESVKRWPEHKAIIRKFLREFEQRSGGATRDAKFGYLKYKGLLRQAVNHHLETIFVELDDLDEFCKRQLEDDASGFELGGASKIEVQNAISKMIEDIEGNALRYQKFLYEACDQEKPERDEGFNEANADIAHEKVMQWRMKKFEDGGMSKESIPPQLRNPFNICFRPRKEAKVLKFREVTSQYVGALVQLDCLVVRCTEVKPRIQVITFQCEMCESEIFQTVEADTYTPPKECPSKKCLERKQPGKLRHNNRTSKFVKCQEMRIQEMSEHVPVGGVPRNLSVVLSGDLCRSCSPGDAITLTGVYVPVELPWFVKRAQGTLQSMQVDAHSIVKHKRGYKEASKAAQEEISAKLEKAARETNLYENCSKSIAPEIFGHADVKKALLLALIGGFTKQMKDGLKIRGEIHTLFMGDPGVAKSQLLKQVCNIAPRSVYTNGKGTSGVGLTASVVRDSMTGEVTLEGGALVLADMGICCIDEFDKMDESDRTAIHEVMEQQSISIAKAGITTTLNTRTTIFAAANPVFGRYDPHKSPVENIDLPPALLSRFDLLFLLLDTVDADKDTQLARHVCKVHSNYQGTKNDAADVLSLGFKAYDSDFMRSYVRKAKTFEPLVTDELQKDLVDAYVAMREEEKRGDIDSRKSYTTPRSLLGIIRLSQANARARFSDRVERQDFDEAMRLLKCSKESVELSAPARKGSNPLDLVYDIVADLSRRATEKEGWMDLAHVRSMSGHKALTHEHVTQALDQWCELNVMVMNPEKTMVRFMVPTSQ